MTRLEKCNLAIKLGFTYNILNGNITTPTGKTLIKTTKNGYLMLTLRDEKRNAYYLLAHQFAFWVINEKIVECIDHIDGNKKNNLPNNLRSVTKSQNAMNMKNVTGISFCKRSKKWVSSIMINYKKIHLGSFQNKDEALNSYKINKEKYHKI